MKVNELDGATLDCWVARAAGMQAVLVDGDCLLPVRATSGNMHYRPSLVWSEGGSIIEREGIELHRAGLMWEARCPSQEIVASAVGHGPTHLIAAMRAFVAARLGSEVEEDLFVGIDPAKLRPGTSAAARN